jgi:hypothetical protein
MANASYRDLYTGSIRSLVDSRLAKERELVKAKMISGEIPGTSYPEYSLTTTPLRTDSWGIRADTTPIPPTTFIPTLTLKFIEDLLEKTFHPDEDGPNNILAFANALLAKLEVVYDGNFRIRIKSE